MGLPSSINSIKNIVEILNPNQTLVNKIINALHVFNILCAVIEDQFQLYLFWQSVYYKMLVILNQFYWEDTAEMMFICNAMNKTAHEKLCCFCNSATNLVLDLCHSCS